MDFVAGRKDNWSWTMMIMQPDWITPSAIAVEVRKVGQKKSLPALPLLRDEVLDEGRSVQIMHVGAYDDEAPTLARLHDEYLPQNGLVPNGRHHEIYIGDRRKAAPDRLKTVLRQPVKAARRGLGDPALPRSPVSNTDRPAT
jgi:hypothetical protein